MKIQKKLASPVSGIVLMLAFAVGATRTASAEDLWDIYQLALANDAVYLGAAANYEAAKLDLPLAKTGFRPTITSNGTLGQERSDLTGSTTTGKDNRISIDFGLPLYNRSTRIGIDQAELGVENARLQFDTAQDELMIRVANSYFNLLASKDNKEVARVEKIAIKRQMDLATERLDVGLGTRTDLFDAQARFQQADADIVIPGIHPEDIVVARHRAPVFQKEPPVTRARLRRRMGPP